MKGHRRVKVWEDNGKVKETEVYLPNIKDIIGFLNGSWDLGMYNDCFDDKNQLGDIDGSIEICGNTLLIEFKRDRTALTAGQLIKAIRQAKHSNITTLFIFGMTNRPIEYLRFSPAKIQGTGFIKADTIGISKVMKQWNEWAKENSKTDPNDNDWTITKRYLKSVGGGKTNES